VMGKVEWGLNPRPVNPKYLLVNTLKFRRLWWMPVCDLDEGLLDYVKNFLCPNVNVFNKIMN